MDLSAMLDIVAKILQLASAAWALIFGSKAVIEIVKSRNPPPTPVPPEEDRIEPTPPLVQLGATSSSLQSSLPSHPRTISGAKRSTLLNVVLAVIVLIASFLLTFFLNSQPPSVSITSPTNGDKVSTLTTVQGTAHNIPKDEELWLFIVPSNQTSYFPQHGPIAVLNEKWSTDAQFGGKSEVGLRFRLISVLVNQNNREAKDAIEKYFQQPSDPVKGIQRTRGMQMMTPEVTVVRV